MLSFQDIMNFSPSNQSNYNELRDLIKNNRIAPFIGAGLTVFCYGTWKSALESLASNLASDNLKAQANDMINSGKYMEAADFICEKHGEQSLKRYMEAYFSPAKLEDNMAVLDKQAIWLLPDLFNHLIFTTNYDQVIEAVYRMRFPKQLNVEYPGAIEILGQILRKADTSLLYKLHGTMHGTHLKNGWILTQQQYNNAYAPDKPLSSDLKAAYSGVSLLFLGCSLGQDRTMKILQESIQERPDVEHYAILSCDEQQRDETIKRLSEEKHIVPILYPNGAHQSVRIILEQLMHDLNPNAYDNLGYYEGRSNTTSIRPYDYDSGYLPFVGEARNRALSTLANEFCKKGNGFKWWAVVGPGGAGKSRIGYELSQKLKREGWYTKWLDKSDYDNLAKLNENEQISMHDTLIVADYVQAYAKEIGAWLYRQINKPRARSLRVLLIERNHQIKDRGDNKNSAKSDDALAIINSEFNKLNWLTAMKSDSAIHRPKLLDKYCHLQDFLELKPFNDKDLATLIISHIKKYNEIHLNATSERSTTAIQPIIMRLKEIDPEHVRPLYAIIITELYLTKHDFSSMSLIEILNEVVTREERLLVSAIKQSFGREHSILADHCLSLWRLATAWQDASLEDIKKYDSKRWQEVSDILMQNGFKSSSFLEAIGLIKNKEIAALRPDLIGEFSVLRWLMSDNTDSSEVAVFIKIVWQKPIEASIFFDRFCGDFLAVLAENQEKMKLLLYPFSDGETEENKMRIYAHFLAGLTYYQKKEDSLIAVERINELVDSYPENESIALAYANGLLNLSVKQDTAGKSETVDKLSALAKRYPDNKEIALEYTMGLFNSSIKQNVAGISETVDKLSALAERYPENEDIALRYAMGLFDLSVDQNGFALSDTLDKLLVLFKRHPENEGIALRYAKGLFNLSAKQGKASLSETLDKVSELAERYSKNKDIGLKHPKGLFHLSLEKMLERLLKLIECYPENEEKVLEYATNIILISAKQGKAMKSETFEKLAGLVEHYFNNKEIALAYVKDLTNLSTKQYVAVNSETVEKLSALVKHYPENEAIALMYAKGLFNLSMEQDETGRSNTVEKLSVLAKRYSENKDMALIYAEVLYNLSFEQDVALIYAVSLYNLTFEQSKFVRSETVEKLSTLVKRHPENEKIAFIYAKGLVNLSVKQKAIELSETIDKLWELAHHHPTNKTITDIYNKQVICDH